MPWVTPSTVNTGDTLQASTWNQDVVGNSLMGHPVFPNEAARDAAISSPAEGQTCYLTSPTVPTATGDATLIPSGIVTVYNGTSWVCVTPVGARTLATGTVTSTSYTATLSGSPGTNPSVTLTTGTTAILNISAQIVNSGTGGTAMSVAVSGATTVAAADDYALTINALPAGGGINASTLLLITGLTAGTNTFTLQYKVTTGTGTFIRRNILAVGAL